MNDAQDLVWTVCDVIAGRLVGGYASGGQRPKSPVWASDEMHRESLRMGGGDFPKKQEEPRFAFATERRVLFRVGLESGFRPDTQEVAHRPSQANCERLSVKQGVQTDKQVRVKSEKRPGSRQGNYYYPAAHSGSQEDNL